MQKASNSYLPWQEANWQQLRHLSKVDKLPHALLFTGLGGIGKQYFADLFSQSLLCLQADAIGLPCGSCSSCQLYNAGNHPNLKSITPDEKSRQIKIDAVRQLVDSMNFSTSEKSYNIVVFNDADLINSAAANSLLKTLEEPVARTLIILISSQPHQLLPTIVSRCQKILFPTPRHKDAIDWLKQKITVSDNQYASSLHQYGGAPLAALDYLESGSQDEINPLLALFLSIAKSRLNLNRLDQLIHYSHPLRLVESITVLIMDIIRMKSSHFVSDFYDASIQPDLKIVSERLDLALLHQYLDHLYRIKMQFNGNLNQQLIMENLLIEWDRVNHED